MRRHSDPKSHGGTLGFSLVELLVVIAIISILAAFYAATLSKAMRKAKEVRAKEGIRQDNIGRMADNANGGESNASQSDEDLRQNCRASFRRFIDLGQSEHSCVTELLYVVQDATEFKAYYHTLIDPANTEAIEYNGQNPVVKDGSGNKYTLSPVPFSGSSTIPVMWEFVAVEMAKTTLNGLGLNVLYADGHTDYVTYPGKFPACREVAECSQQFIEDYPGQQ